MLNFFLFFFFFIRLVREMSADDNESGALGGAAADQLKLTNLIDDCLEHIFMFLDVDDMLSIADTSKQLKTAADTVFARKFGKKNSLFATNNKTTTSAY